MTLASDAVYIRQEQNTWSGAPVFQTAVEERLYPQDNGLETALAAAVIVTGSYHAQRLHPVFSSPPQLLLHCLQVRPVNTQGWHVPTEKVTEED